MVMIAASSAGTASGNIIFGTQSDSLTFERDRSRFGQEVLLAQLLFDSRNGLAGLKRLRQKVLCTHRFPTR
jgi:hypothetical protein